MKKLSRILSAIALVLAPALASAGPAPATGGLELIVSVRRGARVTDSELKTLLKNPTIQSQRPVFTVQEKKIIATLGATNLLSSRLVTVAGFDAFHALKKQIEARNPGVRVELNAMELKPTSEPFENLQWALNNRGEPQAVELDHMVSRWAPGRASEDLKLPNAAAPAGRKIRVAVLDTGADKTHPELSGKFARNESECRALAKFAACLQEKDRAACEKIWFDLSNPEVDQDRNGYPLDCEGWSLLGGVNAAGILGRPDFGDDEGHGTHVAGIIAANGANAVGIRGCSESVELLPVQVLGRSPQEPIKPLSVTLPPAPPKAPLKPGSDLEPKEQGRKAPKGLADIVARGMIYAIRSGAQVVNFSMGWPEAHDSEFMREIIEEAQRRGILIVAAAGNDSTQALLKPCAYPGVLCVAAHGPDGAIAHFSNYGSGVDLAAPGVNILSTWPEERRPVRFRATPGYEFLHGTSQATPYVSCLASELLSRGATADEAYARLVLGARPHQAPLALLQGSPHEMEEVLKTQATLRDDADRKFTLSGNASLQGALAVGPQPLLVPVEKDRVVIPWDRRSAELKFPFQLRNVWAASGSDPIRVTAEVLQPAGGSARPEVVALTPSKDGAWRAGEVRRFEATLRITDTQDPSRSRIPSEIPLTVTVQAGNAPARAFIVRGEIIIPVNRGYESSDAFKLAIQGVPQARVSLLPIDENHDSIAAFQDYLFVEYGDRHWTFYLVSQDRKQSPVSGGYSVRASAKIPAPEKPEQTREQILARVDLNFDGKSEYVIGLMEDNSYEEEFLASPITFYTFDSDFKLIGKQTYDSKKAQIPFQVTGIQVQWQKLGKTRVPSWIGYGKDPYRKVSLRDLWENPEQVEEQDLRFYYVNAEGKLQALEKHENYRIVDLLRPTREQDENGRVPVLLARDTGTKLKPSYIYEFARAEVVEGRITRFEKLSLFNSGMNYRNLLDTRVDSVLSTDGEGDRFSGTFWFGNGSRGNQRLSLLGNPGSSGTSSSFLDLSVGALRGDVDAALWVRAVYSGAGTASAFTLTNSEVQFHDLISGESAKTSLERYTFYEDMFTTNMQFPLVIGDRARGGGAKLPALYTSESSGFTRGVKILIPEYSASGKLVGITAPARLRFQSEKDCKPVETPIWAGQDKPTYFDYYCRDQLIRVPLEY